MSTTLEAQSRILEAEKLHADTRAEHVKVMGEIERGLQGSEGGEALLNLIHQACYLEGKRTSLSHTINYWQTVVGNRMIREAENEHI